MNQEKDIYINNKKVHYSISGKGKPVALIHGFAEDGAVWKYQRDELAKNYQVIIPDLPGSGQSETIVNISIAAMADIIQQVLEAEAITTTVLLGHSMGGYVSLAFAEKYPAMLAGFGLFHSTAYADTEEKKTARRRSMAFIQTHGSDAFLNQSSPNLFSTDSRNKQGGMVKALIDAYKDFDPAALIGYYEAMIQRPDRTAVLQSFEKPILFMIGKQDNAVPFEHSLEQCKLPQISYIHILEHSGHMGMWEEVSKSNSALASFLRDVYV